MKRKAMVFIIAGVAVALAAWQLAPAGNTSGAAATPEATVTPATNAGYVVHLDGNGHVVEDVTPEQAAEFNAELNQMVNTSDAGLVEKPSTVAGGGIGVDLQGRFEAAATATVDANGKLTAPCLTNENDVRAFTTQTAADAAAAKE
jgi:hypothetical protein